MSHFKTASAVKNISNYYKPPSSLVNDLRIEFDRAKIDAIKALEAEIENIKNLTGEQFFSRNGTVSKLADPVAITLDDESGDEYPTITMLACDDGGMASLHFDGHGTQCDGDNGTQVIITNYHGEVSLRVYSDINTEGPTHDISLSKARVSSRSK
jgi:hypothetical protein